MIETQKRSLEEVVDSCICGDARHELGALPDNCIDTIVTSPPYFGQRDYECPEQIGIEKDSEKYLVNLLDVFRQCKRVLKDTGTLWLNIGDKYVKSRLLGIPWRVALRLQDEIGFILRSDIIWHKPNAMPSSVKNRPTTDHEYIFLMSKTNTYYYDADAIREPHVTFTDKSRMKGGRNHFGKVGGTPENGKNRDNPNLHNGRWDQAFHPNGRNKRTVWEIPLSKFRDAHFAVFPEQLVRTCLLASTEPNAVVLDPFMGSGTTAVVARKMNRHFVGVDCSRKYCEMTSKRVGGVQLELEL